MSTAKPDIVTPEQWRAAREALLEKEKAHTRARDAMAAERRRMPMIRVDRDYRFTAPGGGDATLLDLFDGSRQLVVYRFFMDPDMGIYPERGCPGCSMYADQLGNLLHLRERDTRFVAVSRGEQEHLQRYREHMGWEFPWYTLRDDFDADHDVAEWHGTNVFLRDGDEVYRTYFIDARGDEALGSTWSFLDITHTAARRSGRTPPRTGRRPRPTPGAAGTTSTTTHSDVLAHVAGIPVEVALLAAPALLAGVTVIAGYVRATAAPPRR
jgi:predicted dithiol-disulfide oxidoreductase (DUF899 family)